MEMAVFRVHKNENYTVLSNYHFKEKRLTLKAKGLLSLMLSLPDDWDYSVAGLVTLSKDGRDSVNAALKELEKFGYLKRTQAIDENGKFSGYNYEIFEQPLTENPSTGTPLTENPSTENPQQLNTYISNTNKSITKEDVEERKEEEKAKAGGSYDAIINNRIFNDEVKTALYEFIKMRKLIKKPLTDFALKKLINKLEGFTKDPQTQIAILENSILNNYKDIFPSKEEKQPQAATIGKTQASPQGNVTPLFDKIGELDHDDQLLAIKGNVMLSENQIADLLEKIGLEAFDYYVAKLSEYINEHGNIKGHYKTIFKWFLEDSAVAR